MNNHLNATCYFSWMPVIPGLLTPFSSQLTIYWTSQRESCFLKYSLIFLSHVTCIGCFSLMYKLKLRCLSYPKQSGDGWKQILEILIFWRPLLDGIWSFTISCCFCSFRNQYFSGIIKLKKAKFTKITFFFQAI